MRKGPKTVLISVLKPDSLTDIVTALARQPHTKDPIMLPELGRWDLWCMLAHLERKQKAREDEMDVRQGGPGAARPVSIAEDAGDRDSARRRDARSARAGPAGALPRRGGEAPEYLVRAFKFHSP